VFLAKGWKGFFQILICFFKRYEHEIVMMSFDEVMSFLGQNLIISEFYKDQKNINRQLMGS